MGHEGAPAARVREVAAALQRTRLMHVNAARVGMFLAALAAQQQLELYSSHSIATLPSVTAVDNGSLRHYQPQKLYRSQYKIHKLQHEREGEIEQTRCAKRCA